MLAALTAGFDKYGIDEELQPLPRDVADHATASPNASTGSGRPSPTFSPSTPRWSRSAERGDAAAHRRQLHQNEEIKKVSAWAAILFAPTLIGTVYGMNFTHIPELHWIGGYPFALTLMLR